MPTKKFLSASLPIKGNELTKENSLDNKSSDSCKLNLELKRDPLSSSKLDSRKELEFSTSIGQITSEINNYVHVQNDTTFQLNEEEVSVSVVLNYCKNCVFKPYFRLVSIVGLRPIFGQNTLFRLSRLPLIGCFLSSINIFYTIFILLVILSGYFLQVSSCYRQDGLPTFVDKFQLHKKLNSDPVILQINNSFNLPKKLDEDSNYEKFIEKLNYFKRKNVVFDNINDIDKNLDAEKYDELLKDLEKLGENKLSSNAVIEKFLKKDDNSKNKKDDSLVCSGNILTVFIIPDLLHLSAYLFTIYLMRASEIEKTEHLLEKSFLQASQTNGWLIAHRKLVTKLRFFLYLAFFWLIMNVLNHFLHLFFQTIRFTFIDQVILSYYLPKSQFNLQTPLVVYTIFTLLLKDLICSVIIASYAIHCELNISYIKNLCRSLREKKIELQEFVKGIEEARKFVFYLNNQQSFAVSLLTISIFSQLLQAFYKIFQQLHNDEFNLITFLLVTASALLWSSKLLTPFIQASRLTETCNKLRYIGLELRSRPFGYQETLQEDLDSMVIYTCNLRLKGKILHCPIKKSFLWATLSLFIVILMFLGQVNYF